jgi:anti-anti-sigma regulatory factor
MSTAPYQLNRASITDAFDGLDDLALPAAVVERDPSSIHVRPLGPGLDQRHCPAIIEMAAAALRDVPRGTRFAVLDLSEIRTMAAMGVGLCSDFAKRAKEKKLTPVLYGLRGDLLDQLRIFQIDRIYTVVRSHNDLVYLTGAR